MILRSDVEEIVRLLKKLPRTSPVTLGPWRVTAQELIHMMNYLLRSEYFGNTR